jgi:PIN domain nuclease of toxin-antitoxin system
MAQRAFLDTHVAFWLAAGHQRLLKSLLREINSHSETVISAISLVELEIKASLGKLKLPPKLAQAFLDAGIKIEAFDQNAAMQLIRFEALARHDPFDRMILAQASAQQNTTLYSADQAIAGLNLEWVRDCS